MMYCATTLLYLLLCISEILCFSVPKLSQKQLASCFVGISVGFVGGSNAALGNELYETEDYVYGKMALSKTVTVQPPKKLDRPRLYSVEFTYPPSLQPRTRRCEGSTLEKLSLADTILVGENHEDAKDVNFVAELESRILNAATRQNRKMVLALDTVPATLEMQNCLDSYMKSDISETQLLEVIDKNPFISVGGSMIESSRKEQIVTLVNASKKLGIRVIAIGIDAGTQNTLYAKGLDGLSAAQKDLFVPYPDDFVSSVNSDGFKKYTDSVIFRDFEHFKASGVSKGVSAEKYFASRILSDEGISANIVNYLSQSADTCVLAVIEQNRVKFGYGVQERTARILDKTIVNDDKSKPDGKGNRVYSLIVNPSASDSLSQTNQLRLALAFGNFLPEQKPFGDFIWYSESPALRLLTHPKNPISKEGDRPSGESSVIGAFNARAKE